MLLQAKADINQLVALGNKYSVSDIGIKTSWHSL